MLEFLLTRYFFQCGGHVFQQTSSERIRLVYLTVEAVFIVNLKKEHRLSTHRRSFDLRFHYKDDVLYLNNPVFLESTNKSLR